MSETLAKHPRIAYFGTSRFSAEILESLSGFDIALVITQRDKPVGRKQEIQPTPVALMAESLGITNLYKPSSLKNPEALERISQANADLFVVVAYGKIIPKEILDLVPGRAINIHGSLLPKYRGASPIHAAILNGDTETGITLMLMDELLDHGPILETQRITIEPDETFVEIEEKLLTLAKVMIVGAIPKFLSGQLKPEPQLDAEASTCQVIGKEDGKVDWALPAKRIYDKYRAYAAWPGIWTNWNGKYMKISKCLLASDVLAGISGLETGIVFEKDQDYFVQCGEGALQILEVHMQDRTKVAVKFFVLGQPKFVGSRLGDYISQKLLM